MSPARMDAASKLGSPNSFTGFALPISNTTYAPNQFFDVCLPYASRGCVRVVGYLIRKTLGWCDEHGNPTESRFRISYTHDHRRRCVMPQSKEGLMRAAWPTA